MIRRVRMDVTAGNDDKKRELAADLNIAAYGAQALNLQIEGEPFCDVLKAAARQLLEQAEDLTPTDSEAATGATTV